MTCFSFMIVKYHWYDLLLSLTIFVIVWKEVRLLVCLHKLSFLGLKKSDCVLLYWTKPFFLILAVHVVWPDIQLVSQRLNYFPYFFSFTPLQLSIVLLFNWWESREVYWSPLFQVIHYELPNTSELFVHRSGRTGRAGKKGSAILIYTNEQSRAVRGIEHDVGCKFTEVTLP